MASLTTIQTTNPQLTTDKFISFMSHLKKHREYLNEECNYFYFCNFLLVKAISNKSVVVYPQEGSIMICLNDRRWPFMLPLAWRVINLCLQAISCTNYPPNSTASMEIASNIKHSLIKHQEAMKRERSRIPKGLLSRFSTPDSQLIFATKKIDINQATLSHGLIYPLASADAITRLKELKFKQRKTLVPGPCLLVAASKPQKKYIVQSTSKSLFNGDSFIWNGIFSLQVSWNELPVEMNRKASRKFLVKRLTLEFLKANQPSIMKSDKMMRLILFLQTTPSTFLVNFPVLFDEGDPLKFCIPHLEYYSPGTSFQVKYSFLGESFFRAKQFS